MKYKIGEEVQFIKRGITNYIKNGRIAKINSKILKRYDVVVDNNEVIIVKEKDILQKIKQRGI